MINEDKRKIDNSNRRLQEQFNQQECGFRVNDSWLSPSVPRSRLQLATVRQPDAAWGHQVSMRAAISKSYPSSTYLAS